MRNMYLHGNCAPVVDELDAELTVTEGEIPSWLSGAFIRNGANPRFRPRGRHCRIDGDGMLHSVRLSGGRARYRNRFVRTWGLEQDLEAGRALWNGFLEKPDPASPPGPPGSSIYKNTANTSVVVHAGAALAMYEGGLPHRFDPTTLETVGLHDFRGTWSEVFIAHPKVDQATGEMLFISDHIPTNTVQYGVVGPDGRVVHSIPVPTDIAMVMHDMAITETYSVIFALPYTFDRGRIEAHGTPFAFEADRPSRFGVVTRHGHDIRWFEGPASYIFHTLNAFEEGDEIVIRAPRLSYTEWLHRREMFGLKPEERQGGDWAGQMHEWRLNLETGALVEATLDETFVDFPQIPLDLVGRKNRYAYAVRLADQRGAEPTLFDGLVKYDLESGRTQTRRFGPECFGCECGVARRPDAQQEDDVVLTTFVHDEYLGQTSFRLYDGSSLEQIAKVDLPRRVPYGFHGTWIPDAT